MGDDTLHTPLPFFASPDYIGSPTPTSQDDNAAIDLVFVDFIESLVLNALNALQTAKKYASGDVQSYTGVKMNEVLGVFADAKWN